MVNPFGNISNIMQQAKDMQQKFKQVQAELEAVQITGESGAGLVQLTINGSGEALSMKIDDAVYKEDKKILQGLIVAAINDANQKRELKKKEMMGSLMSGMGLPPGFDFLTGKGE
ncbi:MAG TPA: YbaB/EbfC family nucleoid-associated protein [Gammaproteobacteria bacterium]|nr:YbaB/EbfC family nucleoid-associated protein [Gammaproteobacteria bacterium]